MDVEGNLIDPYNGVRDLELGILRATSAQFAEDPLRVLRAFQFVSRFDFNVEPKTIELCRSLKNEYHSLPKERIWVEWYKWARSSFPSNGLYFLLESEWRSLYPELELDIEQDPEWHPEILVSTHTCHVCDAMAQICEREGIAGEKRAILMFGALCHDFGKKTTTIFDGRIRSPGHDVAGVEPTRTFLNSIGAPIHIIEQVMKLVRYHMVHCYGTANLKRLSKQLEPSNINDLLYLIEADHSGRPPLKGGLPTVCEDWRERSKEFLHKKPDPIVMGRHLIDLGYKPGPQFKQILGELYEKQLNGEFDSLEEVLCTLR